MTEIKRPWAGIRLSGSLARIGKYALVKLITIGTAAVLGVLLTIFIANWGGHLDEIRKATIIEEINLSIMEDEELMLMPWEERREIEEQMVEIEKRRAGLDRPFLVRTPGYLIHGLTLNLGWARNMLSPSGSRLVRNIIVERLPATLVLFGVADLLLFFIVLFSALFLSRRYGSRLDKAIIALAPTSAAPGWFYGLFLILIFPILLGVLPFGGMVDAPPPTTTWGYALSLMRHLILPVSAIIISAVFIGIYGSRTFFLIFSSEDYVEMAKAKGLPSQAIERKYILRPTLPPIIWGFTMMIITIWIGGIVLEGIFSWPGTGALFFEAIGQAETPVIVGLVVISAYLLAATLFLMDFVFALLDPRVKVGGTR